MGIVVCKYVVCTEVASLLWVFNPQRCLLLFELTGLFFEWSIAYQYDECTHMMHSYTQTETHNTHYYTLTHIHIIYTHIHIHTQSFHRGQLHPFTNLPADFELQPTDFDVDAEALATDSLNQSGTGFVLRAKEDPNG